MSFRSSAWWKEACLAECSVYLLLTRRDGGSDVYHAIGDLGKAFLFACRDFFSGESARALLHLSLGILDKEHIAEVPEEPIVDAQ